MTLLNFHVTVIDEIFKYLTIDDIINFVIVWRQYVNLVPKTHLQILHNRFNEYDVNYIDEDGFTLLYIMVIRESNIGEWREWRKCSKRK